MEHPDLDLDLQGTLMDEVIEIVDHTQRILRVPSSAFGALRRELIDTLGIERVKGFLLRYGWNYGVNDGLLMKEMEWKSETELLLLGPKMHTLTGYVTVEPEVCEVNISEGVLNFAGIWKDSYEAEEHLRLFGKSSEPVCDTLVGYASGCLSTLMGKTVIVKETKCAAKGDEHCHWVAKTLDEWGMDPQIQKERQLYEADRIGAELEETYEKLRLERDNLSKTYQIHQKLFKQVLHETGLQSFANIMFQTVKIPVFIEDNTFNLTAVGGYSPMEAKKFVDEFKEWVKEQQEKRKWKEIRNTVCLEISPQQKRLITPIYVRQKIFGYCSLLFSEESIKEVDKMVLEQAALACSLHLLNEQTRIHTEQRIRGSFLEDILNKRMSMSEIVKHAHYLEFQLIKPYFMVAIHRRFEKKSFNEEIEFNDQFMNDLLGLLKNIQVNALLGQKSENVIALFSEDALIKRNINKETFCKRLLDFCAAQYPDFVFRMGVSSSISAIMDAPNLYDESLAALKVTNTRQNIVSFDSLGLVGMLMQTKNLDTIEKFAYKILGNLIEEDKSKNMELTKTLYHYLENGSNVHKTARAMNFSISGLRYRLGRLNEILQADINTPYIKHEIYLALQSLIVLGVLEID
ncbi:XylR N-terminal domain-containing protein [Bacillus benzoevorans]|uniref:Sugar diacid utilization regulator n=1 Tax=Bacillus benzoevorans TaxID=1456 RepID=A0A7X0LUS2_9BACI|nr:XylR N-terminal domain-containing protein [Bacillus benzoevorans]MBB6445256.1 sugar diacid utilization regulator [Bacillus benzoevorans]